MHLPKKKKNKSTKCSSNMKHGGFTLIEIMVTVSIIGILMAVALPSYRDYSIRGYITDATAHLAAKRVSMEQYFQDNKTYANATNTLGSVAWACNLDMTSSKYFDFKCSGVADASNYTLQAVGKGPMVGFIYTVNQSNTKSTTISGVSGWTSTASCWITNKGGVC